MFFGQMQKEDVTQALRHKHYSLTIRIVKDVIVEAWRRTSSSYKRIFHNLVFGREGRRELVGAVLQASDEDVCESHDILASPPLHTCTNQRLVRDCNVTYLFGA